MRRARCAVVALVLLGLTRVATAAGIPVSHLYIEANEGGSSGGHAALRIGDQVYHLQHRDALLLLVRAPYDRLVHEYALLDNRTIHRHRLDVTARTAGLLRERFEARLRAQRRQLELRDALREEHASLARLLKRERSPVAGAGYFARGATGGPREPAIEALRVAIAAREGRDFVARRRAALERLIGALDPRDAPHLPDRLSTGSRPPAPDGFGRRYRDLVAGLAALDVLEDAPPLHRDLLRSDPSLVLEAEEVAALAALRDALRTGLARLVSSPRPDWGASLLMGMARLATLDASARSGRLVVLDAYPPEAERIPTAQLAHRADLIASLLSDAQRALRGARAALVADPSEARFADVEDTANRVLELAAARHGGSDLRLAPDRLLPRRAAVRGRLRLPGAGDEVLAASHRRSGERVRDYEALLKRAHGYDLLKHNCVSELFVTAHGEDAPNEIARRLGGYIDPDGPLAVVPFVSSDAVARRWRVVETDEIPSFRRARLEALAARENDVIVMLRESNTLTATSYRGSRRDSFFLFFTDGAVWPRPIFGALNLAANLSQTLLGVLRLPLDGGETLRSGLGGALASAPELAFANIRKGTNDYVPRGASSEPR